MGRNFAIVIGINRYDNLQDLKYAHRDAERVRDWCGEMGFARCCFFAEGTEAIDIDGARFASEPSYGKVIRFLRQFENIGLGLGDTVWFFFAGHGTRWRESDYLMLSDSDPQQGENKPDPALAIHALTVHLRGTGAGNVVLMLDACRSLGGVRDGVGIGGERQQGVITFYSCAPHQQALEIDEIRAGAFTEVLLEGLRRQGEGNCATVGRLRSHLQNQVPRLTEQYRGRSQTPMLAVDPEGKQDLILFPKRVTNPNDWTQLKMAAYRSQAQGNYELAESLWLRVIDGLGADRDAMDAIRQIDRLINPGVTSAPVIEPKIHIPTRSVSTPKNPLPRTDSGSPIAQPPGIVPLTKGNLEGSPSIVDPILAAPLISLVRGNRSLVLDSFEFETCQLSSEGVVIQRQTKTAPYFRQDLGNGVFMDMVVIPGGKFRNIQIPEFCMAKTLITQAQWEAVAKLPRVKIELKSNPSRFKGAKRPVEKVSWWMVEEFCKRLAIVTKRDYRLPAEAQWEYACRSGTTTDYYFGDTLFAEVANYGNSIKETTEVGKYPANGWGLYDMHGNLWEWCADHLSEKFETALKDSNPFLSKDLNSNRVLRGGSWVDGPVYCRSASRNFYSPSYGDDNFGLRLVCSASRTLS